MTTDLNQLAKEVHQANIAWWQDINTGEPIQRNKLELLALVHSEISEAHDAGGEMDDKLPHRYGLEVELADAKIRLLDYAGGIGRPIGRGAIEIRALTIADLHSHVSAIVEAERKDKIELASVCISNAIAAIDLFAKQNGLDIDGAMREKLEFNRTRLDHQPEHRRKEGGKKH